MTRTILKIILLLVLCTVAWSAPAATSPALEGKPANQGAGRQVRFVPLDVLIDSGKTPLAAYQLEIQTPPDVKIVGLEGGDPLPFRDAPYYDPAALMGNRVIIAAFSTDPPASLPTGKTRVARLHLMAPTNIDLTTLPHMKTTLTVATNATGQPIPATVSLQLFQGEKP